MEELTINCGKNSDSWEKLESLCNAEAEKLLQTIRITNDTLSVPCWTLSRRTELIGVMHFYKGENGVITYELDSSESTL